MSKYFVYYYVYCADVVRKQRKEGTQSTEYVTWCKFGTEILVSALSQYKYVHL